MLKDITIGQYVPGDSAIHRLDPRTKIIITLFYIILLFLIKNFIGYFILALFILIPMLISKIPMKYMIKGIRPLLIIIIITVVFNIFLTKGEVIYELGPLNITREGVKLAVFMALRLIFLVTGTSLLTLTTSPISLTDAIENLLNPFKRIGVPAHELAMMMTIALRFIPTLLDETEKIMKAQMARGADFESGNIVKRAKNLVPLLVPLFISAFRRADELAMAMEARCYRGGKGRTRLKQLKMTILDCYAFGFLLITVGFVVLTRFMY